MLIHMQIVPGLIFLTVVGLIFLTSYPIFAIYVTRHGDYYQVRRWKAAIWTAVLIPGLFAFILILALESVFAINLFLSPHPDFSFGTVANTTIELILSFTELMLVFLSCLIPYLFIVTLTANYKLKWWPTSDDCLNKIWKDPKGLIKSPIEWL